MNAPRSGSRDPRPPRRPAASRSSNAVRQALRGEAVRHEPLLAFGRTNWLLMGSGGAAAVLGFVLLARWDTGLAPLLLVVGYCALIPLGIVWREKTGSRANSSAG
ncbi:MAG: hypothetical protein ABIP29_02250 [Candidatus Eisenbacteria bacterium]